MLLPEQEQGVHTLMFITGTNSNHLPGNFMYFTASYINCSQDSPATGTSASRALVSVSLRYSTSSCFVFFTRCFLLDCQALKEEKPCNTETVD